MHDQEGASHVALELLDVSLDEALEPAGGVGRPPPRHLTARWAIGLGLVLVTVAVAVVVAKQPSHELVTGDPEAPFGLEGFAELYVATYLTASGDDGTTAVRRFYPAAPTIAATGQTDRYVMRTGTMRATPLTDEAWEVSVAADVLTFDGVGYTSDGTHHYLVGIVDTPAGLAATSLPVRIESPPPSPIVARATEVEVDDAGTLALVDGFIGAYLAGRGDLRSFVAEDSELTVVTPPPFVAFELATVTTATGADGVPRLHIVATGAAANGSVSTLEYHLSLVVRGGALAVAQVHSGPLTSNQGGT